MGHSLANFNRDTEWEEIERIIIGASTKALDKRNKNYRNRGSKIWNNNIAVAIREKKALHLLYLNIHPASMNIQVKKCHSKTESEN
jgi:hypothetical protein